MRNKNGMINGAVSVGDKGMIIDKQGKEENESSSGPWREIGLGLGLNSWIKNKACMYVCTM